MAFIIFCGGGEKESGDFDFIGGIYGEDPQDEAQEYCCRDAAKLLEDNIRVFARTGVVKSQLFRRRCRNY